jgi:acetyl-CoA carboxylase biotin carboxyl carrier protein
LDLKQIKLIIDLMKRSDLTEFAVEEEGFKLKIRRGTNGLPLVSTSRGTNTPFSSGSEGSGQTASPVSQGTSAPAPATAAGSSEAAEEAGIIYIKSPMVGTFYGSPSPESKAFVEKGAKVTETTVVCIIEAMKIMNEIQAELKGTILEALVENGQPVEYGQRIYKVKQG